jgi:hypothetical protein
MSLKILISSLTIPFLFLKISDVNANVATELAAGNHEPRQAICILNPSQGE